MNLSVVLIAHNEEANIGRMIEGLLVRYGEKIFEIVAVDDVSKDGTRRAVENLMKVHPKVRLVVRKAPCGVGRALKDGFRAVSPQADYVLTMDSDFVDHLEEVERLLEKIQEGYDGVIGSRFLPGSRLVGYPFLKRFSNRAFHLLVRLVLGVFHEDLTNNYKLYRAEIVKNLPWESDGFSMNAETGLWPVLAGYRVTSVPVSWIQRRQGMGISSFKLFQVGPGYASVLWRAIQLKWNGQLRRHDHRPVCK